MATGDQRLEGSMGGAGPRVSYCRGRGEGEERHSDPSKRAVPLPLEALRNGVAGDG